MEVQAIRDLIQQARMIESESGYLHQQIHAQWDKLHQILELPEQNGSAEVFQFAVDYIAHTPDFIEDLYQASTTAGITGFMHPFLNIAEENFLAPVTQSRQLTGLDVLLDKAYFTHRLLEELNDHYLARAGAVLIPVNMTWSNLMVHTILGEPFANDLDTIVEETVQQIMRSQATYNREQFDGFLHMKQREEWIKLLTNLGEIAQNMDIELKLTAQQPPQCS